MDGYPASNTTAYNGQLSNSIGPIKFESEPYHYDVSNNNQNYGYDGSGTYGQTPYQQPGYQYTPAAQPRGTIHGNAQTPNLYNNQHDQSAHSTAVNGDSKFFTPRKQLSSGVEHHCDICDKVFSSSASMRRHREIHTGMKKFACELCGNSYTQKHNLTKHMRLHTGEKPYKCHLCDKAFYIHHHLKNHMFQHTGELPYRCTKCSKCFKHKFRFDRHMLTHEEGGNTDGSVAQTPPSIATSEDNSMNEVWNNDTDDDVDYSYDALMYDSFDEDGNKYDEHECEVCQQIFINKESLDNHFKLQHAVDREFKCDDCNSIFLTRAHLVRHRRTHTGEQIYECEECNVSFRWKVSLHIHMRRHNNDYKRYECTMCNKYFLAKESLKKHMNMHLGMTTYECDECEQKFSHKNEYKNHLQTHSDGVDSSGGGSKGSPKSVPKQPPTCKTCSKTFSSNSSLRKHEFTHMDVKPHKCELCNVSFAQKIQLRLHNKKHNGGKMDPPLFYRKKENQVKKEPSEEPETKADVSTSKRKSPTKTTSPPAKANSAAKISPVKLKIDKSRIIPERRNAPRKARNIIKEEEVEEEDEDEDEEEVDEEGETTEEESEAESETATEESETKKSRWEGYRYPVCENCHQVFKKRKALLRHQKSCKKRE